MAAPPKSFVAIQALDLPDLKPREQDFVKGILSGKTATQAYKDAYDNKKNLKEKTYWGNAHKLRHTERVKKWLYAARVGGFGETRTTLDQHLRELERIAAVAEQAGNYGAATSAIVKRGEAQGHYAKNQAPDLGNPIDLVLLIAKLLGAEMARTIALDHLGLDEDELQVLERAEDIADKNSLVKGNRKSAPQALLKAEIEH